MIDGRLPEAVGGEFVDANGLGGDRPRAARGPRIVVGYQDFAENETLAYLYAEALRGAGLPRDACAASAGCARRRSRAMRRGRIDMWPGYSGSLLGYLGGTSLRRALARIGAEPLALAPAQDRNGFAMKARRRPRARRQQALRPRALLAGASPARRARARAARRRAAGRAVGGRAAAACSTCPARGSSRSGAGVTVAIVDTGAQARPPRPRAEHLDQLRRGPRQRRRRRPQRLRRRRPRRRPDDDAAASQDLSDGNGHGTHVAGIVAAAANGTRRRRRRAAGEADDRQGAGRRRRAAPPARVAEGIRYAAANGARIINLELQGDTPDPRLNEAGGPGGEAPSAS